MMAQQSMDNSFMDRYTGRRMSPQDMIRANAAAEAAENEKLRAQREQYRKEVNQLRQNAEQTRVALQNIEELVMKRPKTDNEEVLDAIKELTEKLTKRMDASDEAAHETGVRIYRNVQASVIEELGKQTDTLREAMGENTYEDQLSSIRRSTEGLAEVVKETGESVSSKFTENAEEDRTYLLEQMTQIAAGLEETKTAAGASERVLRPVVLLSLILTIVNLAVTLLSIFGII